ncbi:hypothetical protein GCM10027615_45590 [Plantactinospora veratri]
MAEEQPREEQPEQQQPEVHAAPAQPGADGRPVRAAGTHQVAGADRAVDADRAARPADRRVWTGPVEA